MFNACQEKLFPGQTIGIIFLGILALICQSIHITKFADKCSTFLFYSFKVWLLKSVTKKYSNAISFLSLLRWISLLLLHIHLNFCLLYRSFLFYSSNFHPSQLFNETVASFLLTNSFHNALHLPFKSLVIFSLLLIPDSIPYHNI